MIACGGGHTIIQNEKNDVYVCGHNGYGQLGLGDYKDRNKFEKVEYIFGKIKNIACGWFHIVIQNEKNEVYVCGNNYYGQLGLGDYENRDKFEKVEYNFGKIKNLACGGYHTIIQNVKNEIYVCGRNYFGQLGLGDKNDRDKFEKVEKNFGEIKKIACGYHHIVIQNEKNEVYVCGYNGYGQLGLGDNNNRYQFEKIEQNFGKIKNIVCGFFHTVIQNEQNEIYGCGDNEFGQFSLGDNNNRNKFEKVDFNFDEIKNIACGGYHIVIQNEKNEVYVCGANGYGQLGLGDYKSRNKFEKVNRHFGEVKNLGCGFCHTVIQDEKNGINSVYVCGDDGYDPLSLNNGKKRNIFEKVDTDDILKKIYGLKLKLNTEEIEL